MKLGYPLLLFVFIIPQTLFAQTTTETRGYRTKRVDCYNKHLTPDEMAECFTAPLNQYLLNSTVLITAKINVNEHRDGTGFLVIPTDRGGIYLVTNKHVIPYETPSAKLKVRIGLLGNKRQEDLVREIEISVTDNEGNYLPTVELNRRKYDVVAIDVTQEIFANSIPVDGFISSAVFANRSEKPEIYNAAGVEMGDEIYVLGYPDAIYDPRNIYPILRRGAVSSLPKRGFSPNEKLKQAFPSLPDFIDGFLIDANVFPGSSGSLVIRKAIYNETAAYVIGIVSDSIPIKDDELKSEQRMALAIVLSTDVIKETIDQLSSRSAKRN